MNSINENKYIIHSADYIFKPFENVTKGSGLLFLLKHKKQSNSTSYILKYKYYHLAINEMFSQMIFEAVKLPFLKTGILICDSDDKRVCPNRICSRYMPIGIEYINECTKFIDLKGINTLSERNQRKTLAKFLILSAQAQNKDNSEFLLSPNGEIYRIDTAELWLSDTIIKCFINKNINLEMFGHIYAQTKKNCKIYGEHYQDNIELVANGFEYMGYDKQEAYESGIELAQSISNIDKITLMKNLEVLLLYYPKELIAIYGVIIEELMMCGKNISRNIE